MKKVFLLLALVAITACKSDDKDKAFIPTDSQVNAACNACTLNIDQTGTYDLNVSAIGSTFNIAANNVIDEFLITGSNNLITLQGCSISVDFLSVTGNDNTLQYPDNCGYIITFDNNTGSGNTLIQYSAAP